MRVLYLWLVTAVASFSTVSAEEGNALTVPSHTASAHSIAAAFEAAWHKHPARQGEAFRRDAAAAQQSAAAAWFPGPPSIGLAHRNDALQDNHGIREWEAEVAVPLWLPGQQGSARLAADAQVQAYEADRARLRWRLAGEVRNAWWNARTAKTEVDLAERRVKEAEQLLTDVERRVRAGDLAAVDRNRTAATVQAARMQLARARVDWRHAQGALLTLTGQRMPLDATEAQAAVQGVWAQHPEWLATLAKIASAQASLAEIQASRRDAPELSFGYQHERDEFGAGYEGSVRIGIRVPFATKARNAPRLASARAELAEAEAEATLLRQRIDDELNSAQTALEQAREIVALAEERVRLAQDSKERYATAFRLGEVDLLTRLEAESELFSAELSITLARAELGRAISLYNQALGMLP